MEPLCHFLSTGLSTQKGVREKIPGLDFFSTYDRFISMSLALLMNPVHSAFGERLVYCVYGAPVKICFLHCVCRKWLAFVHILFCEYIHHKAGKPHSANAEPVHRAPCTQQMPKECLIDIYRASMHRLTLFFTTVQESVVCCAFF